MAIIQDGKGIRCRISMEALRDHFGTYADPSMDIFKSRRSHIEQIATRKIENQQFELDGTILIKSADVG